MSTSIPTSEPQALRAGDTWQWRRELADYPASAWTLKYRFKNSAGGFEITATADGDVHAVTVPAATTAAYVAGAYDFVGWVEGGGQKFTVIADRRLLIEPDLRNGLATAALDLRSNARQRLEALEAAMLARDPSLASYTIQTAGGARTKQFTTLAEVRTEYDKVRAEVQREEAAAIIANGGKNPRHYYVRFAR